jgi:CHAT domain-containing protein
MKFSCIFTALLFCATLHAQVYRHDFSMAEAYLDSLSNQIGQSRYKEVLADCSAFIQYAAQKKGKNAQMMLAQAWSVKGNAYLQSGDSEGLIAALECHEKALDIRLATLGARALEVAFSYHNIGNCYLQASGMEAEAEVWLKKSQRIKQRFPEKKDGTTLESLGNLYRKTNRSEQAQRIFHQALMVFGPNNPRAINTLLALSSIWSERDMPDSSLQTLLKAKDLYPRLPTPAPEKLAVILDKKGSCYTDLGQYALAIDDFKAALSLFNQVPQANKTKVGICLKNTGDAYYDIGDMETSYNYYEQAMALFQSNSFEQAGVLNSVGLLHAAQGNQDGAVDAFRQVVTLLWGGSSPAYIQARATAFVNLGTCLLEREDWKGAAFYFNKASLIFKNTKDTRRRLAAESQFGYCYYRAGDLLQAEQCYQKLLNAPQSAASFPIWFHLGELHEKQQKYTEARKDYEAALSCIGASNIVSNSPFLEETALGYTALARLWLLDAATIQSGEQALQYAAAAIERVRSLKQLARSRSGLVEIQSNLSDPYHIAIDICLKMADNDPIYNKVAFQWAGRYKGNFLRAMAQQTFLQQYPALAEEQYQIEKAMEEARQSHFVKNQFHQPTDIVEDTVLHLLLERQLALKKEMETRFPNLFQQVDQISSPTVEDIQQHLTEDQVLLEYEWTGQQIAIFTIKKDSFWVHTIPKTDTVAACITKLWQYYTHKPTFLAAQSADTIHQSAISAAHFLYQTLLSTVHNETRKTLLIVPDQLLCYLSFDALVRTPSKYANRFWEHQYVVDHYAVQYAQSAGAFWMPNTAISASNTNGTLSVAPVFYANTRLDSLENNTKEAQNVHSVMRGTIQSGSLATKESLLNTMEQYKVLHLATHGVLNNSKPAYSYLAFNRKTDTTDYERLYVSEIYHTKIAADLVTTSACHSGGGKMYNGEGLMSLAHAFQYAGAKNVVASLWAVDDNASPELMSSFYKTLLDGSSIAQAMAMAQSSFAHSNRPKSHPYYWAGFVCWGQASGANSTKSSIWIWISVFSILTILLLFLVQKIRAK